MTKAKTNSLVSSTLAKSNDGTIQLTFTVPSQFLETAKKEVLVELKKDLAVPGFRKGMAPDEKVAQKIGEDTLTEKSLLKILVKAFAEAIAEHKIQPAMYPKFEVIDRKDGSDWQIRAVTCELPKLELGDYKKTVSAALRVKAIWTPDKAGQEPNQKPKEVTREEKEQAVINLLLSTINFNVPKVLIEEEVASRLANLLDRLEKLGLTLDGYLGSIGKTPESLRKEYEEQTLNTLKLELILNKIADNENLKVNEEQIEALIKTTGGDPKLQEKLNTPEQKQIIGSVLRRRAALELLTGLA